MILGISGSPRPDSVTAKAVKKVLDESGEETRFISLAGKKINGCISCLGCTGDNNCVVKDDFQDIAEAMVAADAIIFGAPNYYNTVNALAHSLWERCFCFRHQSSFLLKNKPGIIISTGYSKEESNNPVIEIIENFMFHNKMNVISKLTIGAYSQCYNCTYGKSCLDGNIVKAHGVVDLVTDEMLPDKFEEQAESIEKCRKAGRLLQKTLKPE